MAEKKEKLSEEDIKRFLKTVAKHFDDEDSPVRQRQLRAYRRLKLYWNNFSQIYWSETARDYRVLGDDASLSYGQDTTDQDYYDRPINVFRAFLETIIAALSVQVPGIVCTPDDAENPNDLTTARAGDQIAQLLYKHNDAVFLWLQALYIHMTEGMIASYVYEDKDEKYGTYEENVYKDVNEEVYVCPVCEEQLPDDILAQKEEAEFAPDNEDAELHATINALGPVCPFCAAELDPELQKSKLIVERFAGTNTKPKSRICMDVYGGLYIKIANYAKFQKDTPYLIFSHETHYANVLQCYEELWEDMPQGGWTNIGMNEPYEQYARLNPQYRNMYPDEQVTVKNVWLRPAAFNILPEEDAILMKEKFPDGARVTLVNDICADYEAENLDDCWTLTRNPMHDYLTHDPLGDLVTNIQDIVNDLISLMLQTVEHGIEQTWADPAVVDFNGQSQIEATPGMITPVKLQSGAKNISESFFSTKSASLSPETFEFYNIINQLGQFVSGALPSIFGGQMGSGNSRTASEYALSRSMALQRLQTTWKMLTIWWKTTYAKAIPAYVKCVKNDERYVMKDDSGNFVNVWIRKADLQGVIGSVELEASEQIPVSDEQKADMIMRLFELNNQEIIAALASPENLPFIRKVVKMPEFKLPGENERLKEFEEIAELLNGEPEVQEPDPLAMELSVKMTGQPAMPIELPSVPIDLELDNHMICAEIDRNWLISPAGRLAKVEKPAGYMNVLLHFKAHNAEVQKAMMAQMQNEQQMQQQQQQKPGGPKNQPPKPAKERETVKEISDVRQPVQ